MPPTRLHSKAALVTGSTSGIGLAIARALAAAGADVMLNGFGDDAHIDALRADIAKTFGVRATYDAADVTNAADVAAMVARGEREFGHIDILVNNAGIQFTSPVASFPIDRWDAIVATNLSAAFYATRAALPQMLARNWGRIVNIASAHGLVGSVDKSAYVAAKHGVVGFTKVVALETAKTGVTCNAICPGYVLTPLVQQQIDARAARENIAPEAAKSALLSEKQPSGEFVAPEQIGAFCVFLCSEDANQIRGSALSIDGGWTAE
jgi:3-hydroxybutyrate dehydrogenase